MYVLADIGPRNMILCKLPRQGDSGTGELLAADVGPVSSQLLTRAEGFFNDRLFLPLRDELIRGQVPE